MQRVRVTKYDPALRDRAGRYTRDEWTSSSDVGRVFRGRAVSLAEYLEVESRYVAAALRFLPPEAAHLRVVSLEDKRRRQMLEQADPRLIEPVFRRLELREDQALPRAQLPTVITMILRELLWCRLALHGRVELEFGYDYYMYVHAAHDVSSAIQATEASGLFCESMRPRVRPERLEYTLQRYARADGELATIDRGFARSLSLTRAQARAVSGFSSEHPADVFVALTPERAARLAELVGALPAFEFARFEYLLEPP